MRWPRFGAQAPLRPGTPEGTELNDNSIQLQIVHSVATSIQASRRTSRAASFQTALSDGADYDALVDAGDADGPRPIQADIESPMSRAQMMARQTSTFEEEPFVEVVDLTWTPQTPSLVSPSRAKERAERTRCCRRLRGACLAALLLLGIHRATERIRHGRPPEAELAALGQRGVPLYEGGVLDADLKEIPVRTAVKFMRYGGAIAGGTAAVALSMEPPAGQLASCVALGALLSWRAGASKWGGFGGTFAAMGGAMLGCLAAVVVYELLAPLLAVLLRRCCRGSERCGWLGFMAAGLLPSLVLFSELIRLC